MAIKPQHQPIIELSVSNKTAIKPLSDRNNLLSKKLGDLTQVALQKEVADSRTPEWLLSRIALKVGICGLVV